MYELLLNTKYVHYMGQCDLNILDQLSYIAILRGISNYFPSSLAGGADQQDRNPPTTGAGRQLKDEACCMRKGRWRLKRLVSRESCLMDGRYENAFVMPRTHTGVNISSNFRSGFRGRSISYIRIPQRYDMHMPLNWLVPIIGHRSR